MVVYRIMLVRAVSVSDLVDYLGVAHYVLAFTAYIIWLSKVWKVFIVLIFIHLQLTLFLFFFFAW